MKTSKNKRVLGLEKIKIAKLENAQNVMGGSISIPPETDTKICGIKTLPIGSDSYI
ncbi:hypothetical protein [Aquimarina algiphila]|uniref:hypothetical protein n=1 Tax=Aquimarina algiphila TaxID=2047982 RepID=UPI0024914D35|nr:hypothetical protein [Aquimarina algiphila]